MTGEYRKGYVFVQNEYAGSIEETDEGYTFFYDVQYLKIDNAKPISLTMPLTEDVYFSEYLFPFFDGLIPEGWLLQIVEKKWGISRSDRMGLLLCACQDTIGAVSVKEVK